MKILANDGISKSGIIALEDAGFEVITTKVAQEQVANYINANDVKVSSIPVGIEPFGIINFNKDGYSMYCKEFKEYWDWVEKRNEDRYTDNKLHGKDYDSKNMMHTIRLLQVTEELLRTGELCVNRPNREELLAIRSGKFDYSALLAQSEMLIKRIDSAYEQTMLPESIDHQKLENILIEMRNELY